MKNKRSNGFWISLGLVPYIITLIWAFIAIFKGTSTCFLTDGYGLCSKVYGFRAFLYVLFLSLDTLYPIYLVFLLFIILGFSRKRMNIVIYSRMLIAFGSAPYILSLILFLLGCLLVDSNYISLIFSNIFISHFFIVFSLFVGLFVILLGLSGMNKIEKIKNKKDV